MVQLDMEEFYKRKDLKERALKKLRLLEVSTSLKKDKRELMIARVQGIIETLQELEQRMTK